MTNWSDQEQQDFDQTTSIEYNLRTAGYSTAIVGKYWNDWPLTQNPPNWDRWAVFSGGYNNMSFNVNGSTRRVNGYTTTLLGSYADTFLTGFESNDDKPWYLYLTPQAPHSPVAPHPQYTNAAVADIPFTPAMGETDRSDKPPWVRGTGHLYTPSEVNNIAKPQIRTLMSVDDIIAAIYERLAALGEENTLAIFTSDNGYMWGEHGMSQKRWPYVDSVQVPIYMRWPGHVGEGIDDARLVSHVDIAPTVYEAAGVVPGYTPDGVSLFTPGEREHLYLEYFRSPDSMTARTWASIVTPLIQYVEWYENGQTTFREFYDLAADPWQLRNLLADGNASNDPDTTALSAQLLNDRSCIGWSCPQPAVTIPDDEPPSTPGTPIPVSNEPLEVTVTWDAATDNLATSLVYHLYRDGGIDPIASVVSASSTTVSYTDTGLEAGSILTYSVEAEDQQHNIGERSGISAPVTVMDPPPPPPHIFADDFSAGLGAWTTNSGVTIDSALGDPAPSARAQASNVRRYLDKTLGATYSEVCAAASFNLATIGSGQTVTLIRLPGSGSTQITRVYVNATRDLKLKNDVSGVQFNPAVKLPTGWHRVEICGRVGSSGQVRLWVDTVLSATWTTSIGSNLIAGVQVFDDGTRTFTANVDGVVVTAP
jgi:hypothetical protein